MVTKEQKAEIRKTLERQYEEEFFRQNGFAMNRQQRRLAEKRIDDMLQRKIRQLELNQ